MSAEWCNKHSIYKQLGGWCPSCDPLKEGESGKDKIEEYLNDGIEKDERYLDV